MRQPYRRHKGPLFKEATRLLWLALEERGISHGQAARDVGCSRGEFTRIVYGDKKPGLGPATHIQEVWGINISLWDEDESVEFILPAVREIGSAPRLPTDTPASESGTVTAGGPSVRDAGDSGEGPAVPSKTGS